MNILFSVKPEWEADIRKGFYGSRHKLHFGDFNEKSIAENDLLVPISISDIKYLSGLRLTDNPIPIPDSKAVDICDDKFLFYQTLEEKGFGNYLPKISNDLPRPYILKRKISSYGVDCFVIDGKETADKYKDMIGTPDYFCQQMVEGRTEFATHMIYKNGQILASLNIKYAFDNKMPIKGKNKFLYQKVCSCPYLDLFADILREIGFEGLCCFNYKELNGLPYIIEINPRFGGSLSPFFFSFARHLN